MGTTNSKHHVGVGKKSAKGHVTIDLAKALEEEAIISKIGRRAAPFGATSYTDGIHLAIFLTLMSLIIFITVICRPSWRVYCSHWSDGEVI